MQNKYCRKLLIQLKNLYRDRRQFIKRKLKNIYVFQINQVCESLLNFYSSKERIYSREKENRSAILLQKLNVPAERQ